MKKATLLSCLLLAGFGSQLSTAAISQTKGDFEDKFRQLDEVLPTPNIYRNAAGEPGQQYWQQEVDYKIKVKLLEDKRRIEASQKVYYKNNSPYTLKYLWVQLDQNKFKTDSMAEMTTAFAGIGRRGPSTKAASGSAPAKLSLAELRRHQFMEDNELGYTISNVKSSGRNLDYTIVGTNMRIDLPKPLKPGQSTQFDLDFAFNIVEENAVWARAGYEHFPDDAREGGNDIFLLAQWFPRMVAYTDYEAWTNKEFLGSR